jgi:hypothetical protein
MRYPVTGLLAATLLASLALAACERDDRAEGDAGAAIAPAPGGAQPSRATAEDVAAAAREELELRLGALDERLERLGDAAEGPHEDHVDDLEERREDLADRVGRIGEERGGAPVDPQALEIELQRLDEDIAAVEREVLPDGGDVGRPDPVAPAEG